MESSANSRVLVHRAASFVKSAALRQPLQKPKLNTFFEDLGGNPLSRASVMFEMLVEELRNQYDVE